MSAQDYRRLQEGLTARLAGFFGLGVGAALAAVTDAPVWILLVSAVLGVVLSLALTVFELWRLERKNRQTPTGQHRS